MSYAEEVMKELSGNYRMNVSEAWSMVGRRSDLLEDGMLHRDPAFETAARMVKDEPVETRPGYTGRRSFELSTLEPEVMRLATTTPLRGKAWWQKPVGSGSPPPVGGVGITDGLS